MTDEDLIDGVIVDCDWVKSSRLYEDLEPSKKVGSVIKKKDNGRHGRRRG
jgi:hypothetical protein